MVENPLRYIFFCLRSAPNKTSKRKIYQKNCDRNWVRTDQNMGDSDKSRLVWTKKGGTRPNIAEKEDIWSGKQRTALRRRKKRGSVGSGSTAALTPLPSPMKTLQPPVIPILVGYLFFFRAPPCASCW